MKKIKSILILTFCFALLLTATTPSTTITDNNTVAPYQHYDEDPSVD